MKRRDKRRVQCSLTREFPSGSLARDLSAFLADVPSYATLTFRIEVADHGATTADLGRPILDGVGVVTAEWNAFITDDTLIYTD